jgi:hypothetical protein
MVNETNSTDRELAHQLPQIGFHHVGFRVNEGIKAEDEVDAFIRDHRQGLTIVNVIRDVRAVGESALARVDAGL